MTMFRKIALSLLVLLTVAGALLEGLAASVPPQIVQVNGILVIGCTIVFISRVLKLRFAGQWR